jgi:hypothetical protein
VLDDLSVGALIGERAADVARATLAALDDLAIQCADPGTLLALSATIRVNYPEIAARAIASIDLDGKRGGLSAQLIDERAVLELAGTPRPVPILVRRLQYRWLLENAARREPRHVLLPAGERLASALLVIDGLLVQESRSNGGIALDDLGLLAKLGALHRPAVVASAVKWLPAIAGSRLGSVERGALRELEARLALHEDSPEVALLALNVRMILAPPGAAPAIAPRATPVERLPRARKVAGLSSGRAPTGERGRP